jgi:hypothetical protein
MKSKTLMTLAIASTFGWSAGAFAGASHDVKTPMSVNETGEVLAHGNSHAMSYGSTSDYGSGSLSGTSSNASSVSSSDQFTGLNVDESLALNDGIYSDVYIASWTPVTSEDWMSYVEPVSFDDMIASSSGVDEATG